MVSAEKSVIGCLLTDLESIEKVYTIIRPDMFRDSDLARAYSEIKKIYDADKELDLTILTSNMSDIVGIDGLLVECLESMTTSTDILSYAEIVIKEYKARQLSNILNVSPSAKDIDNQIEKLMADLESLNTAKEDNSVTAKELVAQFKDKRFKDNREQGIPTGIHDLDKIVCGMDKGDLILVAARPGVGKTAFATQIALNTSKTYCTALISLEMTNEQLYDRIIAKESGIELNRIRRACNATSQEWDIFQSANESFGEKKMVLVDDLTTVSEMYMFLKRKQAEIAVIDYAQLITPEGKYKGNRYAEVGEISHALKKMAKKLNIPIVLLTQLNRVKNELSEPTMAEIRESGDFEQDASVIILLWNKTEDKTQKGIKVDKNRNGETGQIELQFDGKVMRFGDFKKVQATPFG